MYIFTSAGLVIGHLAVIANKQANWDKGFTGSISAILIPLEGLPNTFR